MDEKTELEELITLPTGIPGVDQQQVFKFVQTLKHVDDGLLIELSRCTISELGYRIQGQGATDKSISVEGHMAGTRRVMDLMIESWDA